MDIEISRTAEFERLLHELLVSLGYGVGTHFRTGSPTDQQEPDLIVTNADNVQILVESKLYRTAQPTLEMLTLSATNLMRLGKSFGSKNLVLVVSVPVFPLFRQEFERRFPIILIDGTDVEKELFSFPNLLATYRSLVSDLPRFADAFAPERKDVFRNTFGRSNFDRPFAEETPKDRTEYFENRFGSVKSGKDDFTKYEEVCGELLKCLFEENLSGWEPQRNSDKGLNRFDLVCRVNRGNQFWDLIIDEFHSRYVVFEFKNYGSSIRPPQIYTTEKYLFQKALRNVAFVVSRVGLSSNSLLATKGILRETGKLILSLTDSDLLKMLRIKEGGGIPSDYLFDLLDSYLIRLEK